MKIFNWVHNKLTKNKSNSVPPNHHIHHPPNEGIGDWPHGLLAIGTFGNKMQQEQEAEYSSVASVEDQRDYCSSNDSNHTDISVHSKGKDISKRSLSFLLKKMFVCTSGFSSPAPSLRDPIIETPMDKILRTIINKKIYPQNSNPRLSTRKSLESSHTSTVVHGDDKADNGSSKWVKTDSEYIVLEI